MKYDGVKTCANSEIEPESPSKSSLKTVKSLEYFNFHSSSVSVGEIEKNFQKDKKRYKNKE